MSVFLTAFTQDHHWNIISFILADTALENQPRKHTIWNPKASTQAIICLGTRRRTACLLHIFCDNKEQKALWRREYRLGERVLTAFNQDALSGPHSVVDVD